MLAGVVMSAILAGSFSLALSIMAGHPPMMSLLFYSLAGCCGVLSYALQALTHEEPLGRH